MNFRNWVQANGLAYLFALLGVLCAAVARHQLEPVLAGTIPVVLFTVPVVVSALKGGFWPGFFCTLLSAVVADYFFIKPLYSLDVTAQGSVILLTFVAIGVIISVFGQRMKNLQASLIRQAGELAESNTKLQLANTRKDEFLAMLAHELRNPLAGISNAAELLRLIRTDEQRISRAGDAIFRQVRHMTKLVDDLLDVSRVTRGLVAIEKHPVNVSDAVHSALEQVRAALEAKQQHLTLALPAHPIIVCGDRTRLTQVISNLLANANRYSQAGSTIRLQVSFTKEQVTMVVEDNGQGIDEQLQPHIFDLFVQAERGIDRSQGGLGIGLALVKRIADLHDGSVSVYSAGSGKGSSFKVSLPRMPAALAPGAPGAPNAATAKGIDPGLPLHILIVDDNQDAADSTSSLLQAYGHSVVVAYDGVAALERAHATAFDAVILDIGMPDQDGRALCRSMKNNPRLSRTMFIALSGYGQANDLALSEQAGFDRHFTKPVHTERLLDALASRKMAA